MCQGLGSSPPGIVLQGMVSPLLAVNWVLLLRRLFSTRMVVQLKQCTHVPFKQHHVVRGCTTELLVMLNKGSKCSTVEWFISQLGA